VSILIYCIYLISNVENIRTVIVGGSKPLIKYVTACVTLFNQRTRFVKLRARGQAISRAVDTVQLLRSRFMNEVIIKDVQIGEDNVKGKDGNNLTLPVLEILLMKPDHSNTATALIGDPEAHLSFKGNAMNVNLGLSI